MGQQSRSADSEGFGGRGRDLRGVSCGDRVGRRQVECEGGEDRGLFPRRVARRRHAAEQATGYALEHLTTPNGLLYWGGHLAWDLEKEKPVGQYADVHELKSHQPYYRIMWRINPSATRKLMESVWMGHILDWSLLDYNRHASVKKSLARKWKSEFNVFHNS